MEAITGLTLKCHIAFIELYRLVLATDPMAAVSFAPMNRLSTGETFTNSLVVGITKADIDGEYVPQFVLLFLQV
jgi:hypothetical protein